MQRLTRLIKYVSLILGPLVTIALVSIHVLIESGQISVVNDVHTIKQFASDEVSSATPRADDIMKAVDLPEKNLA